MKTRLITLVILFGLLLSACATATTQAPVVTEVTTQAPGVVEPTSAPPTETPSGGTVALIIPEEPTTLNFYMTDAAVTRQVADATSMTGLVLVDENGEFQPVLAAELPTEANGGLSADKLTVTWKLLPDLKWSDGEPLTSDDVKFTWEALSNPASGALSGTGGIDLITSIDTPDALTVVIHYSSPWAGYLAQFAYGIFPRHATGEPADMSNWAWNRQPVGAGPFVVTEWASGESITMEPNPYYFQSGKPYLSKLIFRVVPEPAAQIALMKQGEAQVQLWPGIDDPNEYDGVVGDNAHEVMVPGVWNLAIDFNLSKPFDGDPGPMPPHPILGDIRVRQAISSAINYDSLINDVLHNTVAESTSPFAYGWYKCDIARPYPYDVAKANALLDEAGWTMGSDGIRVAQGAFYAEDGTRLSLELQGYTNFEPLQRTEEFIVENLKAVGIEARIQNYDFSIIFGSYEDNSPRMIGDYDMLIYDRSLSIEPQGTIESDYLSTQIPGPDNPTGGNIWRWVNPEADTFIEQAGSTFDLGVRKTAYCGLGNLIATDLPQLYIYVFQDGYGYANNLTGYVVSTWGSMVWDVQNWQLTGQ
ncbi:MAG: peptide ABC transporter substrate-binding protein [Anaerolineales bacterium]